MPIEGLDRNGPGEDALDGLSGEHRPGRALGRGLAVGQQQDAIREASGKVHVMRDHEDRESTGVYEASGQLE